MAIKYRAQWWQCEIKTGFPEYDTLFYFYTQILESDAIVMRQWSGRYSKENIQKQRVAEPASFLCLRKF